MAFKTFPTFDLVEPPDLTSLIKELESVDGKSTNKKFLPLVSAGLAYIAQTVDNTYYLLRNNVNNRPFTVIFRIPLFKGSVRHDKETRQRFEAIKTVIKKWCLLDKGSEAEATSQEYFKMYMAVFRAICVPQYMKEELLADIDKCKVAFAQISPDLMVVKCPVCDKQFDVEKGNDLITCESCGTQFAI